MKKSLAVLFLLVVVFVSYAAPADSPQERYIEKWAPTAVREMYRSGVPASITLAQGLLESGFGNSPLATEGNNHFGIKCHSDWKGKSMKKDDDSKGECFRVYDDAEESFRDHSDFLRYQDRYKFLFDFDTKDYESWAYGLKKAGYATDPSYPAKLIKNIEDFNLARFDSMTQAEVSGAVAGTSAPSEPGPEARPEPAEEPVKEAKAGTAVAAVKDGKAVKEEKMVEKMAEKKSDPKVVQHQAEVIPDVIPPSPNTIEQTVEALPQASEEFHFSLSKQVLMKNGVPFVLSMVGDSYSDIAKLNGLFLREVLKFNEVSRKDRLQPGTVVYLRMKKTQAVKGMEKYIVGEDGESLHEICQRFAVRMKSICKLNEFTPSHTLREGETILLRKP